MRLEGKKVYLRELVLSDADGNYPNWLNDPEVCRYNSHGEKLYTKEMAKEYIKSITDNPKYKVFAVCVKENDTHIGNISLQSISYEDKSAEFAILFGEKEYMGKGYAKDASEVLLRYGFHDLKLKRIYCGTSEANIPMQKLAASLGMRYIETQPKAFKKHGMVYDIIKYEITKTL
jgi:RimJ/RimL family protein N-acetyltransferase